jgi:hypothetical protein
MSSAVPPSKRSPSVLAVSAVDSDSEKRARLDDSTDSPVKGRKRHDAILYRPDSFEPERHFYPRVLNASPSPQVAMFMQLGNERILMRYCHLHPAAHPDVLRMVLSRRPRIFQWSGADLFNVTNHEGQRQMIIVETNSCPSGQKSMPQLHHEELNRDGYHELMRNTFATTIKMAEKDGKLPVGGLAVIFDKNPMENTGYAAAMADIMAEPVYLAELHDNDPDPPVRFVDRVLQVRDPSGVWHPIRAAFRYVTQAPWTRIPVQTKTLIVNPIAACLAGGRNKMAADRAYELFNQEYGKFGLRIRTPITIRDVKKEEIPEKVKELGNHAVVKIPYSNAGQGVYTITNERELQEFMAAPGHYEKYIVQSLVGNSTWSSKTIDGQFFHTGTIPNKRHEIFVTDLRMQVAGCDTGFQPIGMYARRAGQPLTERLTPESDSWGMLGTNLSVKTAAGEWATESERLLLMDLKDWNKLGLGIDDLIDAYVQTVLATTAIDQMAQKLINMETGQFQEQFFRSLNSDEALLKEIVP